jgi:hypothetical protein
MANILQKITTFQKSTLAYLLNYNAFIRTANTRFENFQNFTGNLGDSVSFDLPYLFNAQNSLVIGNFNPIEQRKHTLTVDKSVSVPYAVTNQERVFNLSADDYLNTVGKGAISELSVQIEADVASLALTNTYRHYGDGVNAPNTYGELAKALTQLRNYGMTAGQTDFYIADTVVNEIINSGLNQFTIDKNRKDFNSWMIGSFDKCDFYRSNLLPLHTAGTVGNENHDIVVDSISADGTELTVTVATAVSEPNAFKENDKLTFQDGVSGVPNIRFLTRIGHKVSSSKVQVRVTEDAATDGGGQTVLKIYPALISTATDANRNINTPVIANMKLKALPNHKACLIVQGKALYLAVPRLQDEDPFKTSNFVDPATGVSMRMYYGSKFGENQKGIVHDAIWGKTLVDEYAMSFILPETY